MLYYKETTVKKRKQHQLIDTRYFHRTIDKILPVSIYSMIERNSGSVASKKKKRKPLLPLLNTQRGPIK